MRIFFGDEVITLSDAVCGAVDGAVLGLLIACPALGVVGVHRRAVLVGMFHG